MFGAKAKPDVRPLTSEARKRLITSLQSQLTSIATTALQWRDSGDGSDDAVISLYK